MGYSGGMKIDLTSVLVNDQEKALRFYTEVLGFVKKMDLPAGQYRWITLVSPEAPDSVQLVLEPNAFPPAQAYQKALFDSGIPATSFTVGDVEAECGRLTKLGVTFTVKPNKAEWGTSAIFDDTCGKLIQIHQVG